jgi:hypothetical protein
VQTAPHCNVTVTLFEHSVTSSPAQLLAVPVHGGKQVFKAVEFPLVARMSAHVAALTADTQPDGGTKPRNAAEHVACV